MKKTRFSLLLMLTLMALVLVISNSCKKDDTDDGIVKSRDKFIGSYAVNDTLYNPTPNLYWYASYQMQIEADPADTSRIIIRNLHNQGVKNVVRVKGSSFSMTPQPLGDCCESLYGTGNISNDLLRFSFTTSGAGDETFIYGSGTKL